MRDYKVKSAKGKGTGCEVWRKPGTGFSQWSHTGWVQFIPHELTSSVKSCLSGKFIRDSVPRFSFSAPRVFIGAWWHRHLLPNAHQNSRLPEEKQVFKLFKHSQPFLSLYCLSMLTIRISRHQPKASPTSSFSEHSSLEPIVLIIFCTLTLLRYLFVIINWLCSTA